MKVELCKIVLLVFNSNQFVNIRVRTGSVQYCDIQDSPRAVELPCCSVVHV